MAIFDDIVGYFLGQRLENFFKTFSHLKGSSRLDDRTRALVFAQIQQLRSDGSPFWWEVYQKCSDGKFKISENQLVTFLANVLSGIRSAYGRRQTGNALTRFRKTLREMGENFPEQDAEIERELLMCVDFVDNDHVKGSLLRAVQTAFSSDEETDAWLEAYREETARKPLFSRHNEE